MGCGFKISRINPEERRTGSFKNENVKKKKRRS